MNLPILDSWNTSTSKEISQLALSGKFISFAGSQLANKEKLKRTFNNFCMIE
jgi:hypothetical protein